ncbi:type I restriction enzyme HsdR N-terminal domain-containing protein [Corynebacterium sanguinis]|uniref:Type I restriction enzyme HsdR N-terminal domain-containing protein n=1 Tax=Corynebacterium sanguinis TaxID=2594913 RepID=A0A838WW19_9CORY|nr:type I restriction enzyme HsdR N-terminal domain-containing protein [Corynebacterium sanguinis]MBA4504955.1 type I restriction enzyme HsdR N-terminal domain-containing protein [Corynebacterium sanguinis]MCT1411776.1 type I restriction enzyme HsdR N-terminal domain-containing protein [Corynebacterium sanguinis]MCT1425288.1 type I restriction enzyme HsdR N-terminal domain-containing protein [Corynebacterium sanguinis]MCT1463630.1 type I restriction enzyme HsdR N-terminal domain-containing prot
MNVEQAVTQLSQKVKELKPIIETEEATKTAFIIPFIANVLGYDVTDPREVIPEYTADVGTKKGEKVDFAIKSGDSFRFLIECKKVGAPLDLNHANQLVRYFNVTDTEFAILTNGEIYEFYTQLDRINRMDEKPFLTLDLSNIDARTFPHLEKVTKANFDAQTIMAMAGELRYVSELRKLVAKEFKDPSHDLVRLFATQVTSQRMTAQNLEKFSQLTHTAMTQYVRDEVNRRLRSAQDMEDPVETVDSEEHEVDKETLSSESSIVTTDEELQAYSIIRAICCSEVPASEISMRDAKSYCAILYQDNNRKPIARLQFDRTVPRIVIFAPDRTEEAFDLLNGVEEIYSHADKLRERVKTLAQ